MWSSTPILLALAVAPTGEVPPIFPREAPPLGLARGDVLEVGDLDGDGTLDSIVDGEGVVCVARGDALGGFVVNAALATGTDVEDLELCDVDGDGDLDLAFTSIPTVFYVSGNDGTGAFSPAQPAPFGPLPVYPRFLEAADFDGDGRIDLVAAGVLAEVRLGDGSGSFAAATSLHLRAPATALELGDFDGDGRSDLAVLSTERDLLSVFRGLHGGGFAPLPLLSGFGEPSALASARLDGDGFDDLVIARRAEGVVTAYLGDGQFHFAPKGRLVIGFAPSCVAAGDFDGDGAVDVVAGDGGDGGIVHAASGDGSGALGPPIARHEANAPSRIGLGDFDGDARIDALAGGAKNGGLSVLASIGEPQPAPPPPLATAITGPVLATWSADLDLDGDLDAVVVRDGPGYADLADAYLGDAAGGWTLAGTNSLLLVNPPLGELVDYDGDALPDLVISGMQQIFVYRGTGSGFGPLPLVVVATTGHTVLDAVPFDGDPRPDLVGLGSQSIFRLVNSGQTGPATAVASALGSLANWSTATTGDADGDGRAEALLAKGGTIHVLRLWGGAPVKVAEIVSPITRDLRVRDLDGDGKEDLVGLTTADGYSFRTILQRGLGGMSFGAPTFVATGGGDVAALSDFDGDGGIDLVRVAGGAMVEIVRTTGDGFLRGVDRFHVPPIAPPAGPSPRLAAGDFDGDGWIDLLFAAATEGASALTIVRNASRPGALAFAPVPIGAGCAGAGSVAPALSLKSGASGGALKYSFVAGPFVPSAPGALLVSPSIAAIPAPAACGDHLGAPILAVVAFTTPGSITGAATLAVEFALHPGTVVPGFAAQAFVADPAAPGGVAATNALWVPARP